MQFMNIITPVFVHVSISFVELAFVKKSIVTILDKNLTCQNIFFFISNMNDLLSYSHSECRIIVYFYKSISENFI